MQTKELSQVFNAAQEATSLASTDKLLIADANGAPKRISLPNAQNQNNTSSFVLAAGADRWVRLAKMTGYGASCILMVGARRISNRFNIPVTMLVQAPHGSSASNMKITILSQSIVSSSNSRYLFSKIRITGSEGTSYVDVLMTDLSSEATVGVNMTGCLFSELVDPVENPETMATVREFVLEDLFSQSAGVGGG